MKRAKRPVRMVFRFSAQERDMITRVAHERDIPASQLVRQAVKQFVMNHDVRKASLV